MSDYIDRGIKEVIEEYPAVADILNEYQIGCGPCKVGTCILKDVVNIHNLTPEQDREMMAKIEQVINGETIAAQNTPGSGQTEPVDIEYSSPIQKLVDEHTLIKRVVALIPVITADLDMTEETGRKAILDTLDFIRSYADKYHHAKEEDILFKYFDSESDIIKAMLTDHTSGRGFVRGALDSVKSRNASEVRDNLLAYHELLTEHIKKEDEILYPWIDRELNAEQHDKLAESFGEVDRTFGDTQAKYERFVAGLESSYIKEEVRK